MNDVLRVYSILLETGDALLKEDGGFLQLEGPFVFDDITHFTVITQLG